MKDYQIARLRRYASKVALRSMLYNGTSASVVFYMIVTAYRKKYKDPEIHIYNGNSYPSV